MDFQAARRAMVDSQLRPQAVNDPLVVSAMATVPREAFVPDESKSFAYMDRLLPAGEGRFLSPPVTLGRLLTELEPRPAEKALVIGTAPGYAAAVLRNMGLEVREHGEGDLTAGNRDGAPYDLILIDGAVEIIPESVTRQLRHDGRLGACLVEDGVQRLVIGTRSGDSFGFRAFADSPAAPLPGFDKPEAFTF